MNNIFDYKNDTTLIIMNISIYISEIIMNISIYIGEKLN